MLISQNQCNLRFPEYEESSLRILNLIIKNVLLEYVYKESHLISDLNMYFLN